MYYGEILIKTNHFYDENHKVSCREVFKLLGKKFNIMCIIQQY